MSGLSKHLAGPLSSVADFEADKIEEKRQTLVDKAHALDDARKMAFPDLPIAGIGSSAWKTMWDAAKAYSQTIAYPEQGFPVVDDAKCPLCIQDIDQEAGLRLKGFQEFIESMIQSEQDIAQAGFIKARNELLAINFEIESQSSVITEAAEHIFGSYLFYIAFRCIRMLMITFKETGNVSNIYTSISISTANIP